MIIEPYETTIAKPYKVAAIRAAVVAAALADRPDGSIFLIQEGHKEVPTFTQPVAYETPANRDPVIAIDGRQFNGTNGFVVEQLNLLKLRAALTLHGVREKSLASFFHPVAQVAYANILAGVVAKKFSIDPKLKLQITTVAAAHYYNITHDLGEGGYSDSELPLLMHTLTKNLKMPMDIVSGVMDKMESGSTIKAFCDNVRAVDGTDRTAAFMPGMLANMVSDLWFGVNANEIVQVSLEHAPTFCALLFTALGEGTFSRGEFSNRLKYVSSVRQKAETFRTTIRLIESEIVNA
jgi:hypothetical protein